MIESAPCGLLSPLKPPKNAPEFELLRALLLFSEFCRSKRPQNVDFWFFLLNKQRQQLDEASFRKNQEILRSTSFWFQSTYFRLRYSRSRIPQSVYRGYFSIESTPKIGLEDLLEEIKKEPLSSATHYLLANLKQLTISPDMYTLKFTNQCYVQTYNAIRHLFENTIHCTSRGHFRVSVIGEPVPVLFYLYTLLAPSLVIKPLLTKYDEYEYETKAPNEYFVLVLFRSSNRPKPFCTKKSTLCYLTSPLKPNGKAPYIFKQFGNLHLKSKTMESGGLKTGNGKVSDPLEIASQLVEGTPITGEQKVEEEKPDKKAENKAEESPMKYQQPLHENAEERSIFRTALEIFRSGHSPGSMDLVPDDLPGIGLSVPSRKFRRCRKLFYKMNWKL